MIKLYITILLVCIALAVAGCGRQTAAGPAAQHRDAILATTTSTQDSGLLDRLIPLFEAESGYRVKTIAVGSGQALALGEQGEADALLVHAPEAEEQVVARGAAVNRRLVMYNDFVIVGPAGDPAGVRGAASAAAAFGRIAGAGAPFVSRGDDSGTHKLEQRLWRRVGLDPTGPWYLQSGAGMGQTLAIAAEKRAYALADRATYLNLRDRLDLPILLAGDGALLNIYHVMQVNPRRFSRVNGTGGLALVEFFTGAAAQQAIAAFGADRYGQPLFFPAAGRRVEDLGSGRGGGG